MKKLLIFLFIILFTTFAFGMNYVTGVPRIIDGDTIEINDIKVRLLCVDTPESKYRNKAQYCLDNETNCGELATNALSTMINKQKVICYYEKLDMYGRALGICYPRTVLQTVDIQYSYNYKLLDQGFAWYYPCNLKNFTSYWNVNEVNFYDIFHEAIKRQDGLWNDEVGGFLNPKDWRKNGGTNG